MSPSVLVLFGFSVKALPSLRTERTLLNFIQAVERPNISEQTDGVSANMRVPDITFIVNDGLAGVASCRRNKA